MTVVLTAAQQYPIKVSYLLQRTRRTNDDHDKITCIWIFKGPDKQHANLKILPIFTPGIVIFQTPYHFIKR